MFLIPLLSNQMVFCFQSRSVKFLRSIAIQVTKIGTFITKFFLCSVIFPQLPFLTRRWPKGFYFLAQSCTMRDPKTNIQQGKAAQSAVSTIRYPLQKRLIMTARYQYASLKSQPSNSYSRYKKSHIINIFIILIIQLGIPLLLYKEQVLKCSLFSLLFFGLF